MITIVYFVRHAESSYVSGMERERGLSEQGKADAARVRQLLSDISIDRFVSSPFVRALETIQGLADAHSKEIAVDEDLRERRMGSIDGWPFREAKRKVYSEPTFVFPDGESSLEAQQRAVAVLNRILEDHRGQTIVVGTHGDIMTLMLNYFDSQYGFDFWEAASMPDIYRLEVDGMNNLRSVSRHWGDMVDFLESGR